VRRATYALFAILWVIPGVVSTALIPGFGDNRWATLAWAAAFAAYCLAAPEVWRRLEGSVPSRPARETRVHRLLFRTLPLFAVILGGMILIAALRA
jgi:hypothetical protein